MKVFLIGKTGQVGSEVVSLFRKNNVDVLCYSSVDFDMTNSASMEKKYSEIQSCDVVINTAAYTQVDKAEDESLLCEKLNHQGAKNIALMCKQLNIPLIHLSTDYVFSGEQKQHEESEVKKPLSVYGQTKALGEEAIESIFQDHLILRVSWIFGKTGANFVKTMVRLLQERSELRVVEDQIGGPTSAEDLAGVLHQLCLQLKTNSNRGIYHYCGAPFVSWAEFALFIANSIQELTGRKCAQVIPIPSCEYPTKAKRPLNSSLSCIKIKRDFNLAQRSWKPYCMQLVKDLLDDQ
jgi:dTDP-4-dehydrorhamnose reductase